MDKGFCASAVRTRPQDAGKPTTYPCMPRCVCACRSGAQSPELLLIAGGRQFSDSICSVLLVSSWTLERGKEGDGGVTG